MLEILDNEGSLGTITLTGNELIASTPALRHLVASHLNAAGGDATAAYQRISAIGNGYIRAVERTMPSDTISSQLAG
ncbi:MAG: hypothetical protein ACRDOK_02695 [Streptosporangiaceae bacterium]